VVVPLPHRVAELYPSGVASFHVTCSRLPKLASLLALTAKTINMTMATTTATMATTILNRGPFSTAAVD
jgi:hypothetical protein